MKNVAYWALRMILIVVFLGVAFFEVLMGISLFLNGEDAAPVAARASIVLASLSCQVGIVGVWRLLTMVRKGNVVSRPAFKYVDMVIGAVAAIGVFAFTVTLAIYLASSVEDDMPPGLVLVGLVVSAAFIGIALVSYILRTVLAQAVERDEEAVALQTELDGVV